MRMMDPKGGHRRLLSMLVVLFLSLSTVVSFYAEGQGSQIGVSNDGPSFISVSIEDDNDLIYIYVSLRDLNGWDDIYVVNVTVFDDQGGPISQVIYRQYRDLSDDTPAIEWEEIEGGYLSREHSTWDPVMIAPWNPENTEKQIGLDIRFGLESFSGDRITITAWDRGTEDPLTGERGNLLSCSYDGPFSADFTPTPMVRNYVIPLGLSLIIATIGAIFMTWNRYKNNKLARAVEAVEAAAIED